MTDKKITIAVDGYSSCGKSTLARDLAKRLNYLYIDSGAMYRAVTLYFLRTGIAEGETQKINAALGKIRIDFRDNSSTGRNDLFLNDENVEELIRDMEVSKNVSWVSGVGAVRKKLVELQRALGKNKGIVMDGRDIGTVVFPDAGLKIFMTAAIDIRAKRRYDEIIAKGQTVSYKEIKKNLEDRDYYDSHREISPLKKAEDAIVLDNSNRTREEQMEWAMEKVRIGKQFLI